MQSTSPLGKAVLMLQEILDGITDAGGQASAPITALVERGGSPP